MPMAVAVLLVRKMAEVHRRLVKVMVTGEKVAVGGTQGRCGYPRRTFNVLLTTIPHSSSSVFKECKIKDSLSRTLLLFGIFAFPAFLIYFCYFYFLVGEVKSLGINTANLHLPNLVPPN